MMARGSTCELQTQLILAVRLGYCEGSGIEELQALTDQIGRMLNGLAAYLKLESNPQITRHHKR